MSTRPAASTSAASGRPPSMPVDRTPFDGPRIDVEARIAWLLRTHRLASADPDDRQLTTFAARLRAHPLPGGPLRADPARLSQWETAVTPVPDGVIAAYEAVLGVPAGGLRGIARRLRQEFAAVGAPQRSRPKAQRAADQRRLDEVWQRVSSPERTGADWLDLAELAAGSPGPLVPSVVFEPLARELVLEMMRSLTGAFFSRYSAMTTLIADTSLSDVVVDTIHDVLGERGVQSVIDAVAASGHARRPEESVRLLRLLEHDSWRMRVGAAYSLGERHARTGLSPEVIEGVRRSLHELGADGLGGDHDLAAWLGRTVAGAPAAGRAVAGGVRLRRWSEEERAVVRGLARDGRTQTGILDDPLFERLVREALFASHVDVRQMAALVLSMSAYRTVVERWCLGVLDDAASSTTLRDGAAELLSYVPGREGRDWYLDSLGAADPTIRQAALTALAHSTGVPGDVDLTAVGAGSPRLVWALTYAAGLSAHPVLEQWAADADKGEVQQASRWWLSAGGAVRV